MVARRPGWWRRLALIVVLAGAGLAGSACQLQLDLNVEVAEPGSGSVELVLGLDADAVAKIGGDLARVMDVSDLVAAGWVVDGPAEEADGFTRVRLRHAFETPAQAGTVIAQLAGDHGPFQRFRVTRRRSFQDVTWTVTGTVDFTGGLEALRDPRRGVTVDGAPLGTSAEDLERQLGQSLSRLVRVRVHARLPGEVTSNATTKADNGAVWQVGFGEGSAVELRATGRERRTSALVVVGLALVAALLLVVVALVRFAGRVTATDRRGRPQRTGG